MFKNLIEWAEGEASRGRKLVLFSTIYVFLFITLVVFGAATFGVNMNEMITTLYITLVGLVSAVYGFYTGTSASSDSVADKTTKITEGEAEEV